MRAQRERSPLLLAKGTGRGQKVLQDLPSQAMAHILEWSAAKSWSVPKGMAALLNKRGAGSEFEHRIPHFVCCIAVALFCATAATISHQTTLLCPGHSSLQDGREPVCGLGFRLVHGPFLCGSVDVAWRTRQKQLVVILDWRLVVP